MLNHKIRYAVFSEFLRRHAPASVLEVGSGCLGLGRYFRRIPFVGVDYEFADYGDPGARIAPNMTPVRSDALALPFRDGSFDAVLSLDMMEHLPRAARLPAARELVRVSRDHVLVAFPCGEAARESDRRRAERLRARGAPLPGWLEEHLAAEWPGAAESDDLFRSLDPDCRIGGNESPFLNRLAGRAERLGRPDRVLEGLLGFRLLRFIDARSGRHLRRTYHLRKAGR